MQDAERGAEQVGRGLRPEHSGHGPRRGRRRGRRDRTLRAASARECQRPRRPKGEFPRRVSLIMHLHLLQLCTRYTRRWASCEPLWKMRSLTTSKHVRVITCSVLATGTRRETLRRLSTRPLWNRIAIRVLLKLVHLT